MSGGTPPLAVRKSHQRSASDTLLLHESLQPGGYGAAGAPVAINSGDRMGRVADSPSGSAMSLPDITSTSKALTVPRHSAAAVRTPRCCAYPRELAGAISAGLLRDLGFLSKAAGFELAGGMVAFTLNVDMPVNMVLSGGVAPELELDLSNLNLNPIAMRGVVDFLTHILSGLFGHATVSHQGDTVTAAWDVQLNATADFSRSFTTAGLLGMDKLPSISRALGYGAVVSLVGYAAGVGCDAAAKKIEGSVQSMQEQRLCAQPPSNSVLNRGAAMTAWAAGRGSHGLGLGGLAVAVVMGFTQLLRLVTIHIKIGSFTDTLAVNKTLGGIDVIGEVALDHVKLDTHLQLLPEVPLELWALLLIGGAMMCALGHGLMHGSDDRGAYKRIEKDRLP